MKIAGILYEYVHGDWNKTHCLFRLFCEKCVVYFQLNLEFFFSFEANYQYIYITYFTRLTFNLKTTKNTHYNAHVSSWTKIGKTLIILLIVYDLWTVFILWLFLIIFLFISVLNCSIISSFLCTSTYIIIKCYWKIRR